MQQRDKNNLARQRGFTLIEVMVAVAVLGIVLAFGVPSFRNSTSNASLRSTAMDLVMSVNAARADAVNLRKPITLESDSGDANWTDGWKFTHPEDGEIHFSGSGKATVTETGGLATATFGADGTVQFGGAATMVFEICDDRTAERGRRITINRLGRINNEEIVCP